MIKANITIGARSVEITGESVAEFAANCCAHYVKLGTPYRFLAVHVYNINTGKVRKYANMGAAWSAANAFVPKEPVVAQIEAIVSAQKAVNAPRKVKKSRKAKIMA